MAFDDMLANSVQYEQQQPEYQERYHGDLNEEVSEKDVIYGIDRTATQGYSGVHSFALPVSSSRVSMDPETKDKVMRVQRAIRQRISDLESLYMEEKNHPSATNGYRPLVDVVKQIRLQQEAEKLQELFYKLEDGFYDYDLMHEFGLNRIYDGSGLRTKALTKSEQKERDKKEKAWREKKQAKTEEMYESNKQIKAGSDAKINPDFLKSDYMKEKLRTTTVSIVNDANESRTVTQEDLLKMVLRNDFSNLEKLDKAAKHLVAAYYMENVFAREVGAMRDPAQIVARLNGIESHPLLRIGISLAAQGRLSQRVQGLGDKAWFEKLDELLNTRMMEKTLTAAPNPSADISQDDIRRNTESQMFMAKTMLICHMSKFTISRSKEKAPWEQTVANAFAHCSRVGIILPGVSGPNLDKEQDKMIDHYTGAGQGLKAGFYKRFSATHALDRKSKDKDDFKEKKWYGYNPWGQFGMNVAVGGLGNDGITGEGGRARKFKNDGTSGHLYMKLLKGGKKTHTSMLIGFESDGPLVHNQLGHIHGLGNGEFQSSFGGQRVDEVGDKYGGRTADLSAMSKEDFETVMMHFENTYKINQRAGAEGAARNADMVKELCGQYMNRTQYTQFLIHHLNMDPAVAGRIGGSRAA